MAVVKFWFRIASSVLLACVCGAGHGQEAATTASADPAEALAAAPHSSTTQARVFGDLHAALSGIDGSKARFEQTVLDEYGQILEVTQGWLLLARPRVRWEVLEPFPQSIVLDERLLRIYDPDLEQVTERVLAGQGEGDWSQVPLALLTRSDVDLAQHFQATVLDEQTFRLQPLAADALLKQLVLAFDEQGLQQLRVEDHAGQVTLILFSDVSSGQVIESSAFQLALPPDVEIVRG